MPQAMQAVRIPNEAPRSLSDWTIDAAFELDEALNGRRCNAAVVEGFFEAFRAAGPYKENGTHLTLVDATARDRVRGALRQLHALENNDAPLDDSAIKQEVAALTARAFEQRLIRALQSKRLTGADRNQAERLRKFMLRLHKSLIADSVKAAVYWHGRLDE